ncbi:uncharacterized protein LOC143290831 [Babylonia areolata]|uniref:uncharacterized protein LOC143290831 n=1 Tax=Babylonia areolata TaxID=304850 RepID=UPI003FD0EE07
MALWKARRVVYKLGVLGLYAGFLLYIVGFSTPYWFYATPSQGSQGLWEYCNGRCHKLEVEEEWFEAVRAVLCITLIVYMAACVLVMYDNCLAKYDPLTYKRSYRVEIVTVIAGVCGVSGLAVYTLMMKKVYVEYKHNHFGHAYVITGAGCGASFLIALLLAASGGVAQPQVSHV